MGEKFDPSPIEIAEHERAAEEVTRLRRKGIHCHVENHADGPKSHVDVVRDSGAASERAPAISSGESRKDG